MDQESLRLFDDLQIGDWIEVHHRPKMQPTRIIEGEFNGFGRGGLGGWYLVLRKLAVIRTIDIEMVRLLVPIGEL